MGLEIASQDKIYLWREEAFDRLLRYVVFPERSYETVSISEMIRGVSLALHRLRPDAIAINGYSSLDAWTILALSKVYGCRTILMTDSKVDDAPRSGWKEMAKGRIVQQFDAALCAGTPHRGYLQYLGMDGNKIFDGYDAVDNDFFWKGAEQIRRKRASQSERDDPFFLVSARFIKGKNLDGLLLAYAEYRGRLVSTTYGRRQPWRLVILGDGPEHGSLENLVYSKGIEGVSFPGFVQIDKLPLYYGRASVFIHPSYKDTWGLVVNEAMASGLPVLVSNQSGCRSDLICEGENGFSFEPGDVTALADLMVKMSSDQMNLKAMGISSLNRIKEWGLKRFAEGLYGAFQAASQGNTNRSRF